MLYGLLIGALVGFLGGYATGYLFKFVMQAIHKHDGYDNDCFTAGGILIVVEVILLSIIGATLGGLVSLTAAFVASLIGLIVLPAVFFIAGLLFDNAQNTYGDENISRAIFHAPEKLFSFIVVIPAQHVGLVTRFKKPVEPTEHKDPPAAK